MKVVIQIMVKGDIKEVFKGEAKVVFPECAVSWVSEDIGKDGYVYFNFSHSVKITQTNDGIFVYPEYKEG